MFNPIKNVVKGIGLLQGFFLSKDLPQPVSESLKILMDAVEKPLTQWRQPITLEDDEIERIAHLISQRIIDEGPHKLADPTHDWEAERTELVNRNKHLEGLLDEQKAPDTDPKNDPTNLIITAVQTGKSCKMYPSHADKKMCYRCWNLTKKVKGGKYQRCAKYGISVRATTAERICNSFEQMPDSHIGIPVLKCISCNNYDKEAFCCDQFQLDIEKPNRNMWGVCPYWKTRFNEPLKFNYADKQTVKKVDAGYVDLKRNLESQNAEGGPL